MDWSIPVAYITYTVLTATSSRKNNLDWQWMACTFVVFFSECQHLHSNGLKYPRRLYNLHSVDRYVKPKIILKSQDWQRMAGTLFFSSCQHLHSNGLKYPAAYITNTVLTATSSRKNNHDWRRMAGKLFFSVFQHLHSNGLKYHRRLYNLHSVDRDSVIKKKKHFTIDSEWRSLCDKTAWARTAVLSYTAICATKRRVRQNGGSDPPYFGRFVVLCDKTACATKRRLPSLCLIWDWCIWVLWRLTWRTSPTQIIKG